MVKLESELPEGRRCRQNPLAQCTILTSISASVKLALGGRVTSVVITASFKKLIELHTMGLSFQPIVSQYL